MNRIITILLVLCAFTAKAQITLLYGHINIVPAEYFYSPLTGFLDTNRLKTNLATQFYVDSSIAAATFSSGSGEVNTASNLGGGVGLFYNKSGVDLRFNSLESTQFTLTGNVIALNSTLKAGWDAKLGWTDTSSIPGLATKYDISLKLSTTTAASTYALQSTTVNGHALSANVTVTKGDVGLGNADNTSDAAKPVSTAQQTALDLKLTIAKYIVRETPSGSVNGSNVTFTLANTPVSGTEHVYQNGLLLDIGGTNDYTISSGTITFVTAPTTGDKIRVTYISQ